MVAASQALLVAENQARDWICALALTRRCSFLSRDPVHFGTLTSTNQKALTENWVLRFNHLKRLYKLVIRYFEYVQRD